MKPAIVIFLIMLVGATCGYIVHENGYQSGYNDGKVGLYKEIVLGLVLEDSNYYIINKNYGSIRVDAYNQTDAIKALQKEISPCL